MPRRSDAALMRFLRDKAAQNLLKSPKAERGLSTHLLLRGFFWQYPIILRSVRGSVFPIIFDFYHPERKLAVEVDGGYHKKHKGADDRRDRVCVYNGITVSRFTNRQAENVEWVLEKLGYEGTQK